MKTATELVELHEDITAAQVANQVNQVNFNRAKRMNKQGGIVGGLLSSGATATVKGLGGGDGNADGGYDDKLRGILDNIFVPAIESELKHIRAKTMLHDLIANDEIIQQYDPDKVIQAYSELSQIAPKLADKPIVIRGALRKVLQQEEMEPFEVKQLTDIHKSIDSVD